MAQLSLEGEYNVINEGIKNFTADLPLVHQDRANDLPLQRPKAAVAKVCVQGHQILFFRIIRPVFIQVLRSHKLYGAVPLIRRLGLVRLHCTEHQLIPVVFRKVHFETSEQLLFSFEYASVREKMF